MLKILFFILLFIVLYTYIGYGIIISIIVRTKRFFTKDQAIKIDSIDNYPAVTLFITAYNEEDSVDFKMHNSLSLNYPKKKLTILWVTDGSTDSTNDKISQYENAKILYSKERKGKTAAMNRGMNYVDTPIVIFTDANTILNKDSILEIVKCFKNKKVGCVSGEKRIFTEDESKVASIGEGFYWKYESYLKKMDSELYSTMGAAGELFGVRKELYKRVPEDTLLDDFTISMKIVMDGYKIEYCDKAYAMESGSANIQEEKKRKIRIAAGGIQSIYRLKGLLNIFKYKTLSFQYISHRALRWSITPISLFLLLPINIAIIIACNNELIYVLLLIGQLLFYILAFIGFYNSKRDKKNKLLYIPYYFFFMNINVIYGIIYLIKKKNNDGTWEKSKRA